MYNNGTRGSLQPAVLSHFGLRENPFGVTPDPKYLYFSHTHREALASLINGIDWGFGFQVLVAQPGMGKTTLLLDLLSKFRADFHTAFLFQPQISPIELLQSLLAELEVNSQAASMRGLCEELNVFLVGAAKANNRVVIILDEAQNLDFTSLELLRQLSNFETSRSKLMNVILAGQPHLLKRLSAPEQQQLQQRISAIGCLSPLSVQDTSLYIEHRLKIAGYGGVGLFPPSVIRDIWQSSKGIPRNINRLCFNTMLLAFTQRVNQVNNIIVREAICDLDPDHVFSQMHAISEAPGHEVVQQTERFLGPEIPVRPDSELIAAPGAIHIGKTHQTPAAATPIAAVDSSNLKAAQNAAQAATSSQAASRTAMHNFAVASNEKGVDKIHVATSGITRARVSQANLGVGGPLKRSATDSQRSGNSSTVQQQDSQPHNRIWLNVLLTTVVAGLVVWFVIERAASSSWSQSRRTGPAQSILSSTNVPQSDPQLGTTTSAKAAPITTLYFDEDSTDINSQSGRSLQEVAEMLAGNAELYLVLEGHTDNSGPEAYNLDLSNRRSLAVRDVLSSDLHVSPERLELTGRGSAEPAQSNASATGRAYNRRVEIRMIERGSKR